MIDRDALSSRLSALENFIAELHEFRRYPREQYAREPALHHLAERFLHLACECVLDIAHHVIADQGYRQPANYRDAMAVLAEEGVLGADLAERLKRWMGFRNVLVHFYVALDHGRTFDAIQDDLRDLEDFARALAPLLGPDEH